MTELEVIDARLEYLEKQWQKLIILLADAGIIPSATIEIEGLRDQNERPGNYTSARGAS